MIDWTLRPAGAADIDFLFRVYASTRLEELAATRWAEAQVGLFLRQQFEAQDRHYRQHYACARFDIVQCDGADAGRLYVDRSDGLHLIDIALLPAHRGRGLGSAILRRLAAEADQSEVAMNLHVEAHNPARRIYERLGFVQVGDTGVYLHLRRGPVAAGAEVSATLPLAA